MKADVWILTDGNSTDANEEALEKAQSAFLGSCCMEKERLQDHSIFENMNGFGRVVYYDYEGGSQLLMEGHFRNGTQDGFGRLIDLREVVP